MGWLRGLCIAAVACVPHLACNAWPSAASDGEEASGADAAAEATRDAGSQGDADVESGVQTDPETLSFPGTSTAQLHLEIDGPWSAKTSANWLSVSPPSGSGDASLTVTVERTGLDIDTHTASITIEGGADAWSVPVLMRFPEIEGTASASDGSVFSAAASPSNETSPSAFVAGEIVIRLDLDMVALESLGHMDSPVDSPAMEQAVARLGARVDARRSALLSPALGLALLEVEPGAVEEALAALAADGRTLYAERNALLHPTATDDPHYDVQWHYQHIDLEGAWDITTGDRDVTVAVVDGDFHPSHPDLAANLLPGWNFIDDTDDILILNEECAAHGTHVAGTVAAVTNNGEGVAGVAPDVRVLPLNVALSPDDSDPDSGCGLSSAAIARAILYAAGLEDPAAGTLDQPVDVINLSLGGEGSSRAVEDALEVARDARVVSIAAAGNTGSAVRFPANLSTTLAVSATDQHFEVTDYSSRGPEVWVAAPGGDLTQELESYSRPGRAPRAGVLSTGWAYDSLSSLLVFDTISDDPEHAYLLLQGTSMASPHVAGVVSLMRSANPHLNLDAVATILADTALDLGPEGRDDEYGHGLVQAAAAVQAATEFVSVPAEEIIVRLFKGDDLLVEVQADSDGAFHLGQVAAGEYRLDAGDFGDEPPTVYGEASVTVDYEGDIAVEVALSTP